MFNWEMIDRQTSVTAKAQRMLSNAIKSLRLRYAFAGTAFGSVFSSCALAYDAAFISGTSRSLNELMLDNPVHMAIGMVPAILGYTFYKIGESRAELLDELKRREQVEAILDHSAHHDALTGLLNRRALDRTVGEVIETGIGPGNRPAMMLLDLDKFKYINDTMGHNTGDAILIALAERLSEATSENQSVFRLGGDEFVILWHGEPDEECVRDFCGALIDLIAYPFDIAEQRFNAGGSIGITWFEPGDRLMADALGRADLALYRAKAMLGSCFCVHDALIAREADDRMNIEAGLRRAVADNSLHLEFQPIVDVESDMVRGFEALARWRCGERILKPEAFIPVAERCGLIVPIGRFILAEACRAAAGWPAPVGVSVNVAADQFKDQRFVAYVDDVLRSTGLNPKRLTLEFSEQLFSTDVDAIRDTLRRLKLLGVHLAIDDFGTGFSSIAHLRSFPIDMLKIDRSFTERLAAGSREADLVRVMQALGDAFEIETLIEGVETPAQLAELREAGIRHAQGYWISRPLDAAEVGDAIVARMPASTLAAARPHILHA